MNKSYPVSYLKRKLNTRYIGRTIRYLPTTTSTMDEARKMANSEAAEGTVVIAGQQEAGRGRLGRSWLSPEGGLATSIIFRPDFKHVRLLPAVGSIAVLRCINLLGIKAAIKWPNDVLVSGKKVCGILIENMFEAGELMFSVMGIGINVNFDIARYPEISQIATSLSAETGKDISVPDLALNLYTELEALYDMISKPDVILSEWVSNMNLIGKLVTVNSGGTVIEGIAEGINGEGNLTLRLKNGKLQEIVAGEVSNVRELPPN